MNINKVIAKTVAGSNSKVIHGQCIGQINPYIEWIKWLSYESEYEKQICDLTDGKTCLEVSHDELQKVSRIRRNRVFANLFKKYGTSECSEEEYIMVYDYMCTESIENLMISKLSSQELCYAKEKIIYFSQLTSEELSKKVHEEQVEDVYDTLSMVDSYVLHVVSNNNFAKDMERLNKEIDAQIETNIARDQRSLYYASNPYLKK